MSLPTTSDTTMRLSTSRAVWSHWSPRSPVMGASSAGSNGSQFFCLQPTNGHFSSSWASLMLRSRTRWSCTTLACRPNRIAIAVTPHLLAPVSRAVLRIPRPSLGHAATASIRLGSMVVLNNAVPLRSENSVRQVEQRKTRHRPPPLPVRTERLPLFCLPTSAQSALTQHNCANGSCSAPSPSSGAVILPVIWSLLARRARCSFELIGIGQECAPFSGHHRRAGVRVYPYHAE